MLWVVVTCHVDLVHHYPLCSIATSTSFIHVAFYLIQAHSRTHIYEIYMHAESMTDEKYISFSLCGNGICVTMFSCFRLWKATKSVCSLACNRYRFVLLLSQQFSMAKASTYKNVSKCWFILTILKDSSFLETIHNLLLGRGGEGRLWFLTVEKLMPP